MSILELNKKLNQYLDSKKDLMSFYFQPVKSQKNNILLRNKRKELALLILEDLIAETSSINSNLVISIEKDQITASPLLFDRNDFFNKTKKSEIVFCFGNFEMNNENLFSPSNDKNFYFEIPVDGYIFGSIDPLMIIEDYFSKKVA